MVPNSLYILKATTSFKKSIERLFGAKSVSLAMWGMRRVRGREIKRNREVWNFIEMWPKEEDHSSIAYAWSKGEESNDDDDDELNGTIIPLPSQWNMLRNS